MGRIGFVDEDELKHALAFIKTKEWLEVTGVFTHFATADEALNKHYEEQVENFQCMLSLFR